jgi:hypothetical protein
MENGKWKILVHHSFLVAIYRFVIWHRTACLRTRDKGLGSLPAVDHPRDAESIDNHAKTGGPESLL